MDHRSAFIGRRTGRGRRHAPRHAFAAAAVALALAAPPPAPAEEIQDLDGIRLAVESFVAAGAPEGRGEPTVEVGNLDSRLRLAPCGDGLRTFYAPGARNGSRRTVGVSCPGPKPWTVYVAVRMIYHGEVVVAARALPRGAVLAASDLVIEERNLDEGPSGYLTNPREALGKRITRPLRAGLPVSSGVLENVQVVDRGQRVWLLAGSRQLAVRMSGTALEKGAPGDLIRVQNDASRKVVQGVIGDDGLVRVDP